MGELIEISIKGSLFYCINTLSAEQLVTLQEYARQFYMSNPSYADKTDEAIIEDFILMVRQILGISLNRITMTAVLIIK